MAEQQELKPAEERVEVSKARELEVAADRTAQAGLEAPAAPQTPATASALQFQTDQRMARLFVMSGLFSDIKGNSEEKMIAQAYVKIALGRSMGFSEAESMQGIDLIQGRPAIAAQLRAARMQRSGYHWRIRQLNDEGCVLDVYQGEVPLGQVAYMQEDAQRAKLLSKDNWRQNPQDMYFARAITRAQRRFAPGVLSADLLSTEEALDLPPVEVELPQRKNGQGKIGAEKAVQLFNIAKQCGVTTEQLGVILATYEFTAAEDVTHDLYEEIVAEIRKVGEAQ